MNAGAVRQVRRNMRNVVHNYTDAQASEAEDTALRSHFVGSVGRKGHCTSIPVGVFTGLCVLFTGHS